MENPNINNGKQPEIDATTLHAAELFTHRIKDNYQGSTTILFGSRARRSHHAESDADIAVLLPGKKSASFIDTKLAMADIAYEVLLDTGILVQALPLWEDDWQHPEHFSNPALIQNIKREGIAI